MSEPAYDDGGFDGLEGLEVPDYGGGAQGGYADPYGADNGAAAAAQFIARVEELAKASAQAQLAGPLADLARAAQDAQNDRLHEAIDAVVTEIEHAHPGESLRDNNEFLSFLSSFPIDGSSKAGIRDGLNEAYECWSIIHDRRQRERQQRETKAEWAAIKAAPYRSFSTAGAVGELIDDLGLSGRR